LLFFLTALTDQAISKVFLPLPPADPDFLDRVNGGNPDLAFQRKEGNPMPSCHEMRMGEVYACPECGLELKVVKECKDAGTSAEDCACHVEGDPCTFSCCGGDMVKKGS
jgi:hypothetical protein